MLKNLFVFGALTLVFLIPSLNAIVIPTNCSQPLSVEGATYLLESDLTNYAQCYFTANYVTLDCQGNTIFINSTNSLSTQRPLTNITIRNCTLLARATTKDVFFGGDEAWSMISFYSVNNAIIENNRIQGGLYGISLGGASHNAVLKQNFISGVSEEAIIFQYYQNEIPQNISLQNNFLCFNQMDLWCGPKTPPTFINSFNNMYETGLSCQRLGLPPSQGFCNPQYEERIHQLETQVDLLEQSVLLLQQTVDSLQTSLSNFMTSQDVINTHLDFLPYEDRKSMVCGYIQANNLTNETAFGLSCSVDGNKCYCNLPNISPVNNLTKEAEFVPNDYIYDDFSQGGLDPTKWLETSGWFGNYVSEHYVDSVAENYHTNQLFNGDRSALLAMTGFNFTPGYQLDFDVYYQSGSGQNQMSLIRLNGVRFDYILPPQQGCYYCGAIGYWNEEMDMSNQTGHYHYRIFFNQNNVTIGLKRPDESLYNATVVLPYPITFGVETITGGNGYAHFDYDNFVIRKT